MILLSNPFPLWLRPAAGGSDSTLMMFLGALIFWLAGRRFADQPESKGYRIWVDSQEPICAGLIAGAALVGIGDILVRVFVFD